MFYLASLYIALIIFGLGLIYKVSTWFRYSLDPEAGKITTGKRVSAAVKGTLLTIFSKNISTLVKVFILDVLLQFRILRESRLRWVTHMCIFYGFMLLLLMHSLDKFITSGLFKEYAATLNPFFFLRNLFFAMVIVGLATALYRRFVLKLPHLLTNAMDKYSIIILAVIMISGVLLEGTKIVSHTSFQGMIEEYGNPDDKDAVKALEAYWVKNFGVVSPNVRAPFDEDILAQGRDVHEENCAGCHSRPQWAFTSYGVAKIIKPIGLGLDRAHLPAILWYIHFLACFIGLAYLPFSKMFHIFASVISLLVNAVMDKETSDPANIATRQLMELDACTHCGTCSLRCSVGVSVEEIANFNILPSEKMAALKSLAAGKALTRREIMSIQEGLYLCTNCYRCTEVCPVGINLQELWFKVRELLLQKGYPELLVLSSLSYSRGLMSEGLRRDQYEKPVELARKAIADECALAKMEDRTVSIKHMDKGFKTGLARSGQGNTFSFCFTCSTCTAACPVVRNFDNPPEALGLVPHQIMHAASVGLSDLIFTSNMLWSCLGCYQCQEHCPQGVNVPDILYELKNLAIKRVKEKAARS
jgi:heterodisulfide reductase subunit C/nitrate reductase gamma subunit